MAFQILSIFSHNYLYYTRQADICLKLNWIKFTDNLLNPLWGYVMFLTHEEKNILKNCFKIKPYIDDLINIVFDNSTKLNS